MIQEILQNKQQLAHYHQAALKQREKNYALRKKRWEESLLLAQQVAQILKEKFHIAKVVLFGSILDFETFTLWSDIDIAVWGLDPNKTLSAIEEIHNLSESIDINLVDINTVKPEIYQRILEKHQEI